MVVIVGGRGGGDGEESVGVVEGSLTLLMIPGGEPKGGFEESLGCVSVVCSVPWSCLFRLDVESGGSVQWCCQRRAWREQFSAG